MASVWENHKGSLIALLVAAVVLVSSMVIVPETQQAVIIQAGRPDRVANRFEPDTPFGQTGAGIIFRIPFYERVQNVDKRLLSLDMERQQVLSKDQQRLQVDAYARFRIIDPVKMVETAGSVESLRAQLAPILASVLRQELGRRTFAALLTADRGSAMANIKRKFDNEARQYGVQVIDVRIKHADLPDGRPLTAAFTRMETDRQEEAATIRAQGQKKAQIIGAEAEAEAARIYAEAYGKDPEFYDFYRAMQSYRKTFVQGDADSSIILSPDNEYLKQFQGR